MGSYINQREINNCVISKDDIPKAVKALNELGRSGKRLCWVDEFVLSNEKDIVDIMHEARWDGFINDKGDYELECFIGEKYGSDYDIFTALAPFMPNDSYVEMEGESSEIWRWCFKNGELIEKIPKIIWD